jgi:hypothetical protein
MAYLVNRDSIDDYLTGGQCTRPSDAIFQKEQRANRELRERAKGMKRNLSNKMTQFLTVVIHQQLDLVNGDSFLVFHFLLLISLKTRWMEKVMIKNKV